MKNLTKWVLKWAHSPFAPVALFILAFSESVFFPVPPDILLVVLIIAGSTNAFKYALICTFGSVCGAVAGYFLGHFIWLDSGGNFTWFADLFFRYIPGFSSELFESLKALYIKWDFWIVFTGGFAPVPYKIFTITAGVFDVDLTKFFISSLVSRGLRYLFIAFLLWKFGASLKDFTEKYYKRIALVFTVSLLSCIAFFKYIL